MNIKKDNKVLYVNSIVYSDDNIYFRGDLVDKVNKTVEVDAYIPVRDTQGWDEDSTVTQVFNKGWENNLISVKEAVDIEYDEREDYIGTIHLLINKVKEVLIVTTDKVLIVRPTEEELTNFKNIDKDFNVVKEIMHIIEENEEDE